jgi:hypothetical protein
MPNLANIENPTEDQEQEAFVQWLRLKGYPHFRVPNETYTRSWSQKAKNKKLGVSSGVPDLFIAVPFPPPHLIIAHKDRDDEVRNKTLVAIEMKRKKGGITSANQKKWIKTLNEAGVQTVVCKGCDAAIEFIESIT